MFRHFEKHRFDTAGDVRIEGYGLRAVGCIDVKQHLLARRDRFRSLVREHLHIQVDTLGIEREYRCLYTNRRAFLDLVQIVDVRLQREQRAASRSTDRIVQADAVHECIGREAEDQHVERVTEMAVVVDPFGPYRVAINSAILRHSCAFVSPPCRGGI
ncbi:hypothetical protein BSU04_33610 [Caballeronia sordidicola]|uniref:Uncharacterized protein n=1 Tax=Caballeronia sordidicola TaxID=196367 RepID=A0A226WS91_CABSO|nr:hypothetical protein BSU04_33610 [Caballeronia sordidicola]